jgi:hypothetical protein
MNTPRSFDRLVAPVPPMASTVLVPWGPMHAACSRLFYFIAIGFTGEPTARVIGSGGAQKKNS